MATLRRLGSSDLSYVPAPDEFAALAAATLGNAGTATDGHDSDMAALAAALAGDSSTPGLLDGDLTPAGFTDGYFRGSVLQPIVTENDALRSGGDSALGGYSAATGTGVAAPPGNPPAPAPAPAPLPAPPPPPEPPSPEDPSNDPCQSWDRDSPLCFR